MPSFVNFLMAASSATSVTAGLTRPAKKRNVPNCPIPQKTNKTVTSQTQTAHEPSWNGRITINTTNKKLQDKKQVKFLTCAELNGGDLILGELLDSRLVGELGHRRAHATLDELRDALLVATALVRGGP